MNEEEKIDFIVDWLAQYAHTSRTNGFVIGISGGIDSAVTSTLCAKTGKPLLVVSMPIHQNIKELNRATEHIEWLSSKFANVEQITTDLTNTFEAFSSSIPASTQDHLSMANARARLRMTTLYTFAGNRKALVVGTGNKVEDFGVGFFTKYGDGGVDLSPIADLYKSEVFSMAKQLGICLSIQEAAPTDGLWGDDRNDEDQLGASYDELEWAMEHTADDLQLSARQLEVQNIYHSLNKANKHKVDPIPVCKLPKH